MFYLRINKETPEWMISQFAIPQVVLYTINAMDTTKSTSHTEFADYNAVVSHGQNLDVVSEIVIVIKLKRDHN